VLHRHAGAPDPDRGRGADDDRLRWWVDGIRQQVGLGRARAVRAERCGTPVGAGVLVWEPRIEVDRGHLGLAVVTDLVVHPAHRGLGVARTVVAALVQKHLADFPAAHVAAIAERPHGAGRVPTIGSGWRRHAGLLTVGRPDG
jgi:GNAT superfamily N-acetyltransferase